MNRGGKTVGSNCADTRGARSRVRYARVMAVYCIFRAYGGGRAKKSGNSFDRGGVFC